MSMLRMEPAGHAWKTAKARLAHEVPAERVGNLMAGPSPRPSRREREKTREVFLHEPAVRGLAIAGDLQARISKAKGVISPADGF